MHRDDASENIGEVGTVLVAPATGTVGRQVAAQLQQAGINTRALALHPDTADFPAGVQVVPGDLADPASVAAAADGVDAVFLLWPFFDAGQAPDAVKALTSHASRVVYLSAMTDGLNQRPDGFWGEVEDLIVQAGVDWTFLRAGGLASNTFEWADDIRADGVVNTAHGELARPVLHEADIAAVALAVLTSNGHAGKAYDLTGPALVTQAEQVRLIGQATGRRTHLQQISLDAAREQLSAQLDSPEFVDAIIAGWAAMVDDPEPVTDTVEQLTAQPARTFAQWATDHADDFAALSMPEIAQHYVGAFREDDFDAAVRYLAADMVRIAPLETGGSPVEVRGLDNVIDNAAWLSADYDTHHVGVDGPYLGPDDQFAVRFAFDETHIPTGQRATTTKMSLYTVTDGRIVREQVHYFDEPQQTTSPTATT